MTSARVSYKNLTKGDIVELQNEAGTRWGIYVDIGRVVHAVSDETKEEKVSFLRKLFSNRSSRSTVKINKIQDLVPTGHFSKNNFKDSFWCEPSSPDQIAERALREIGYKTHRDNVQFVQYCRYGSERKLQLVKLRG